MDESFSPTLFLYGMALVLAVGKAFTLTIWRTLPRPRPGLRQEMLQAWKNRRLRKQAIASSVQQPQSVRTVNEPSRSAEEVKDETYAAAPTLQYGSVTQSRSSTPPEN
jgi:hypothetical protein